MLIPVGSQKAIPIDNTIYIPYDICRMLDKRDKCHLYWDDEVAFSMDPRKLRMIHQDWFAPHYDMLRSLGSTPALFVRESASLGYGHFKLYNKDTNEPVTMKYVRNRLYNGSSMKTASMRIHTHQTVR